MTLAADRRLHTAQPSLSRQIRDLEAEVGVQLHDPQRRVGIELTAAGRAFLDHARLALAQVEAAGEAPRDGRLSGAEASLVIGVSDRIRAGVAARSDVRILRERTAEHRGQHLQPDTRRSSPTV